MDFRYIKIKELQDFLDSDIFRKSDVIPITSSRAISQLHNPDADKEDVALIFVEKDSNILGYIGILPCILHIAGIKHKIYTNSGWWIHPQRGKKVAIPLFYKMLELYGSKLFFADLTPHTTQILSNIGIFRLPPSILGYRVFISFTFFTILARKVSALKQFNTFFKILDAITDSPFLLYRKIWNFLHLVPQENSFKIMDEIDKEADHFIKLDIEKKSTFRDIASLHWICKYKWLINKENDRHNEASRYYFSTIANKFEYKFMKIYENNILSCILMISNKDGEVKIPYIFGCLSDTNLVLRILKRFLINSNINSLIVYNSLITKKLTVDKSPFLLLRVIEKQEAFSHELMNLLNNNISLQDGDGDMIFT